MLFLFVQLIQMWWSHECVWIYEESGWSSSAVFRSLVEVEHCVQTEADVRSGCVFKAPVLNNNFILLPVEESTIYSNDSLLMLPRLQFEVEELGSQVDHRRFICI